MMTRSRMAASAGWGAVLWMATGACSLEPQGMPLFAGPSELGLSLVATVTPDVIPQDGRSRADLAVVARDASGRPVAGLPLRLETWVAGRRADFGRLSTGVMTTGRNGRAHATYWAPETPPPVSEAPDTIVTFIVVPVGSNYANAVPRRVELRLTPPVVIYAAAENES